MTLFCRSATGCRRRKNGTCEHADRRSQPSGRLFHDDGLRRLVCRLDVCRWVPDLVGPGGADRHGRTEAGFPMGPSARPRIRLPVRGLLPLGPRSRSTSPSSPFVVERFRPGRGGGRWWSDGLRNAGRGRLARHPVGTGESAVRSPPWPVVVAQGLKASLFLWGPGLAARSGRFRRRPDGLGRPPASAPPLVSDGFDGLGRV